jgi:hypothetical protein
MMKGISCSEISLGNFSLCSSVSISPSFAPQWAKAYSTARLIAACRSRSKTFIANRARPSTLWRLSRSPGRRRGAGYSR